MNRGDRREAIFREDRDRELFLATLAEACGKADWQSRVIRGSRSGQSGQSGDRRGCGWSGCWGRWEFPRTAQGGASRYERLAGPTGI